MRVCVCVLVGTFEQLTPHSPVCVVVSADVQEEQHANTSANYDVELLHHRDAHMEFFKSGEKSLRHPVCI